MYKITKEQLESLLNYLSQRPYLEVHEGIKMLQNLPIVEEKKE
jgi:hypothetical protein